MLKDTIQGDMKNALKAGDSQKRTVLGMLLSAIKNKELEKRNKLSQSGGASVSLEADSQLSDEEVHAVLGTEIKKRKESIATYEQAGHADRAAVERAELDILMTYMPEQLSADALRVEVETVLAEVKPQGPKDMGRVIAAVMARVKGKADGQSVSALVKELLHD